MLQRESIKEVKSVLDTTGLDILKKEVTPEMLVDLLALRLKRVRDQLNLVKTVPIGDLSLRRWDYDPMLRKDHPEVLTDDDLSLDTIGVFESVGNCYYNNLADFHREEKVDFPPANETPSFFGLTRSSPQWVVIYTQARSLRHLAGVCNSTILRVWIKKTEPQEMFTKYHISPSWAFGLLGRIIRSRLAWLEAQVETVGEMELANRVEDSMLGIHY